MKAGERSCTRWRRARRMSRQVKYKTDPRMDVPRTGISLCDKIYRPTPRPLQRRTPLLAARNLHNAYTTPTLNFLNFRIERFEFAKIAFPKLISNKTPISFRGIKINQNTKYKTCCRIFRRLELFNFSFHVSYEINPAELTIFSWRRVVYDVVKIKLR